MAFRGTHTDSLTVSLTPPEGLHASTLANGEDN
jgi:hypothetical protein